MVILNSIIAYKLTVT